MTLVGKRAPEFQAKALIKEKIDNNFSLSSYHGKYVLFFFYPMDFTFVCPTELHAFQDKLQDFKKKDCNIVACSTDSVYSHFAWLGVDKSKGGIKGIEYPIASDITKRIKRKVSNQKDLFEL
jgi:peroxiredoxin 2/4